MANEFIIKNGFRSQGNSEVTGSLNVTEGITGSISGTASFATTASYALDATNAVSSSYPIATLFSSLYSVSPLTSGISANNVIALGNSAGYLTPNSDDSNFLGYYAGSGANYSSYSNFIGKQAGLNATSASNSNFIGTNAGKESKSAYNSNFIGFQAGLNVTDVNNSNFIGQSAGYNVTRSFFSNFLGTNAGSNADESHYSNFLGESAGASTISASNSNFLGFAVGVNTSASFSNFLGSQTGQNATNASNSNFLGQNAGSFSTNASFSNFLGFRAGELNTITSHSIFIGYRAGSNFSNPKSGLPSLGPGVGPNNIIIGNNITLAQNRKDSINIGAIIFATGSYSQVYDNTYTFSGSVGDGKVGINVETPTAIFHISSSGNTSSTTSLLVQNSNQSPSLAVLDNGDIGIGTNTPINKLHIVGGGYAFAQVQAGGFGSMFIGASGGYGVIYNNNNNPIIVDSANYISLWTNSTSRLYITTTGEVGIGTDTPTSRLQVKGAGTTSDTLGLKVTDNNDVPILIVQDDKRVGINKENTNYENQAWYDLHVSGTAAANDIIVGNTIGIQPAVNPFYGPSVMIFNFTSSEAGYANVDFRIQEQPNLVYNAPSTNIPTIFTLKYDSKVGIGVNNTQPTAQLHIKTEGSSSATQAFLVETSGSLEVFKISDDGSATQGFNNTASGNYSHAEGISTKTGIVGAYRCIFSGPPMIPITGSIFTLDPSYGVNTSSFTVGNQLQIYNPSNNQTWSSTISSVSFDGIATKVRVNTPSLYFIGGIIADIDTSLNGDAIIPARAAHAEGSFTKAYGIHSHAEGLGSEAIGIGSHAEGTDTTARGYSSHAEGYEATANGDYSHAEGNNTVASGLYSHAEGQNTSTTGNYSHAEGTDTFANGASSHAEGYTTFANGYASHAEGRDTQALGDYSHAEGYGTTANGNYSHAEGESSQTYGSGSHAEGWQTQAGGNYSHAEGFSTQAIGSVSHAEGSTTVAAADSSHAEGIFTTALDQATHAEGFYTVASGFSSHAEGRYTQTVDVAQHAQGQYNLAVSGAGAFILGNGIDDSNRSNLIFASGSEVQITGSLLVTGSASVSSLTASNATISGNVTVLGTASINTLIVNQIGYSSGSNQLGDSVTDTQTLYGTVVIPTGSLTVTGSTIISSSAATQLRVGTNTLFVSSSGAVGIGTSTPSSLYKLEINGNTRTTDFTYSNTVSSNGGEIRILQAQFRNNRNITHTWSSTNDSNSTADLGLRRNNTGSLEIYDGVTATGLLANRRDLLVRNISSSLVYVTGSSTDTLLKIDSSASSSILFVSGSGRVGIGTNAPLVALDVRGTSIFTNPAGINYDENIRLPQSTAGYAGIALGGAIAAVGTSATQWTLLKYPAASSNTFAIRNNTVDYLSITTAGNVGIGSSFITPTARLQVRGGGATSATTTFLLQNNTPTNLMTVLDNGQVSFTSPTIALATSQSAFTISQSISASNVVGGQYYGVNITPTFFATTASQTETALRVAATFTGSAAAVGGQNIIADFGATSAGSQFTVTDVTSGSIYMVNDVSGLPIIEATSDWTVNMYNYPNLVFNKTGSQVNIFGTLRVSGSFILPLSQSAAPQTGSAYWSGSFLFIYDGTQYRSSSFA